MNVEYNHYKEFVEKHILDFLPEVDHKSITVYNAMKYSLEAGGKRLRPVLLLAACDFTGGDVKSALPYACALEYIHTYSLIHDDLPEVDNDDLRRGKPTNHIVFGHAMALLAGDALLSTAFEIMNKDMFMYFQDPARLKKRICASYEIAKSAGCRGMIVGQVADIEAEGKLCSTEMLDYIHLNKTAALITAAVRAGAHLGESDDEIMGKLTMYAENLGLAFQIADDILDVVGNERDLGKKTGMDSERNKSTYPALYGLDASRKRLKELSQNARDVMAPYYDNAEFFTDLIKSLEVRIK
ncbi:MAG: polyprenyl synthetase family protein [Eubacteriales bacterium]|nr:polyprenyl synthetase family protein [Eubacteriales bacterium]MDD4389451.1 polyprenyl synthetase family protein [Eubacteriales bacterium]